MNGRKTKFKKVAAHINICNQDICKISYSRLNRSGIIWNFEFNSYFYWTTVISDRQPRLIANRNKQFMCITNIYF